MVKRSDRFGRRPPQVNVNLTEAGIKNHPLAIASVAIVSTIGLMLLLFNEVIFPIRSNNLEIETIKLRNEVAEKTIKIISLNAELKSARNQLYALQTTSLFSKGNPFPLGLRKIKPGSTKNQIEASFLPTKIDKTKNGYWSIKLDHSTFDEMTVYFSKGKRSQSVSHLTYKLSFDHKYGDDFLQNKLVEALGTPRRWLVKDFYSWETKKRAIYKRDNDRFIVMNKGEILALWPSQ